MIQIFAVLFLARLRVCRLSGHREDQLRHVGDDLYLLRTLYGDYIIFYIFYFNCVWNGSGSAALCAGRKANGRNRGQNNCCLCKMFSHNKSPPYSVVPSFYTKFKSLLFLFS